MKLRLIFPLIIASTAVIFQGAPNATVLLEYNRGALGEGEYWRILTGHLVHFNTSHLVWDVGTLFLLATLMPLLSVRGWLGLLGGAGVVISAGVWVFAPQFEFYRGLSGLDCALFGATAMGFILRGIRQRDYALLGVTLLTAIGFLAKCQWELRQGSALFAQSAGDFVPVPLAHLLGAVWGMISILMSDWFGEYRSLPLTVSGLNQSCPDSAGATLSHSGPGH